MYLYIHACVVELCVCECVRVCTYLRAYIHTHMHVWAHTHTQAHQYNYKCKCIIIFVLGLMTQSEADLFQKIPSDYNKFYIPIIWATTLVVKARRENRVRDDFALKTLLDVSLLILKL